MRLVLRTRQKTLFNDYDKDWSMNSNYQIAKNRGIYAKNETVILYPPKNLEILWERKRNLDLI